MTLEYTATDINSLYESLKRKLSLFDAVNQSASASLNHCANLFAQSATIHQNQPLVSPPLRRLLRNVWKRSDRADLLFRSWLTIWFGDLICNCTQPHGAGGILGQPLAAFAHHASTLQASASCKLCIKITSPNDAVIPPLCAMCSPLLNPASGRFDNRDFRNKKHSPPPAAMLPVWLPGDTRVCVSLDEGLLPSLSREELESDSID